MQHARTAQLERAITEHDRACPRTDAHTPNLGARIVALARASAALHIAMAAQAGTHDRDIRPVRRPSPVGGHAR